MNRRRYFTGRIAILFLAVSFFAFYQFFKPSEALVPGPESAEGPSVALETNELEEEIEPAGAEETGEVKGGYYIVARVVDGDTIELENGEKVRYIGIDTPETKHPNKTVQCFGAEAAAQNKKLVEGKAVRLEKDVTDRDRYGRLLRYVYVGDLFINYELARQGFAMVYTYPPDVKYNEVFLEAQKQAREEKLGLWNMCR